MPGRMGGGNVTKQNLLVQRIDTLQNIIYVRGGVPGPPGGFVRITDALKKVGWKAGQRAKLGVNMNGEILEGITGLPMPVGSVEMARDLPREVEVGKKRVVAASK